MDNPWKHIDLGDYEKHMSHGNVMQLQALNGIMKHQLNTYSVSSAMILGIAGGNGLEHIKPGSFEKVYGVDINPVYLKECEARCILPDGEFAAIEADLLDEALRLPHAELIVADLLIEYIGYPAFARVVRQCSPKYVSCVIQLNIDDSFVSDTPYIHVFDGLDAVHHFLSRNELDECMRSVGFTPFLSNMLSLPNGKALLRLDYCRE